MTLPPKPALWTSFLWDLTPEQALAELAAAGWQWAELSEEHSRVLLQRPGGPRRIGRDFRVAADDAGVRVTQGHLDLEANIADPDRARRRVTLDSVKARLEMYLSIGITAAVIHPGGRRVQDPARRLALQVKSLEELTAMTTGTDTWICLENVPSAARLDDLLSHTAGSCVGACLDTGHLNLTDEDPAAWICSLGPRLRALHLSDNDSTGDQHLFPPSEGGTVSWPAILAALADIGYEGLWNFELPGENQCCLSERKMKLAVFRQRAEACICPSATSGAP